MPWWVDAAYVVGVVALFIAFDLIAKAVDRSMMAVFCAIGVVLGIAGVVYMGVALCRPERF